MSTESRLDALERQMKALRKEVRRIDEHVDTISSPPWKRVWFFLQGFRLWRLGVWYRAPWNRSAWE